MTLENGVLVLKDRKAWGWIQLDGTINWSNGYATRLTEDPCEKKQDSMLDVFDWDFGSFFGGEKKERSSDYDDSGEEDYDGSEYGYYDGDEDEDFDLKYGI